MNRIILLFAACLLTSCATQRIREHLTPEEPKSALIKVDFIPQEKNLCGPTVLKMASQKYLPDTPFEIYKMMTFREQAQGTFKSDMISSARRLGLSPYKIPSLEIMFKEVNEGTPVIVFQNLGLSWYPIWHYALLIGYDSDKNVVYLHSGTTSEEKMNFSFFTRTWRRGEYWSYVVVPPDIIPTYASFDEALDNAIIFEKLNEKKLAESIYKSMGTKWPERFESHLGLANIYYDDKKSKDAIKEIKTALKINPNHPALLYNLAVLYHETGNPTQAQLMKKKTLAAAPAAEKESYIKKFDF